MKLKSLLKLTSMVLIAVMLCGTTACQLTQQYLKQRYPTLYSTNGVPSGENATTQQPIKLLNDYPTTCAGITFTTTKTPDEYPWYETITVTKRGHEPQTFDIEGFQCSDDQPLVHFVDANFDGHTDIYIWVRVKTGHSTTSLSGTNMMDVSCKPSRKQAITYLDPFSALETNAS